MIWKSIVVLVLLLPSFVFANSKDTLFDIKKYSGTFWVLEGKAYGTNVGIIVSGEELLLIDPMPGENALDDLHLLIKKTTNLPISYVTNTHNHEDHSGGNEYFQNKGAKILEQETLNHKTHETTALLSTKFGLDVVQVKSHTSLDSLYFHSESNILFVGDVFDNSWHPTFYAGGIEGFTATINKILATGDENTLIIPGHGAPASKKVVETFYKNTIVWLERISTLLKENMSIEQIMEDQQINEILQRFNTEQRKEFIPERAFKRFIERSVSIVASNELKV